MLFQGIEQQLAGVVALRTGLGVAHWTRRYLSYFEFI